MKPAIIAALVAALLAGGFWYRHHVYESGYTAGVVAQKAIADKALRLANAANQKKSNDLQDEVDVLNANKEQDDAQHAKNIDAVRAAARAGTVRLSIPGACTGAAGAGTQASTAGQPVAEERTNLLPGTADDILRIAGDSAQSVRDFNRLLDQYNAVCK